MTIKLISGTAPSWYAAAGQEKEPTKAEFRIRPLTQSEYMELIADHFDANGNRFRGAGFLIVLRAALLDWRGVLDADGKEVRCTPAAIETLPFNTQAEVSREIIRISRNSEDERKN